MKYISELPEKIKKIAVERKSVEEENLLVCAFSWSDTPEGQNVWEDVNRGDYQSFYDFYSKDKQELTPEEWCEEKGYNKYYSMIINQYLTDMQ